MCLNCLVPAYPTDGRGWKVFYVSEVDEGPSSIFFGSMASHPLNVWLDSYPLRDSFLGEASGEPYLHGWYVFLHRHHAERYLAEVGKQTIELHKHFRLYPVRFQEVVAQGTEHIGYASVEVPVIVARRLWIENPTLTRPRA